MCYDVQRDEAHAKVSWEYQQDVGFLFAIQSFAAFDKTVHRFRWVWKGCFIGKRYIACTTSNLECQVSTNLDHFFFICSFLFTFILPYHCFGKWRERERGGGERKKENGSNRTTTLQEHKTLFSGSFRYNPLIIPGHRPRD